MPGNDIIKPKRKSRILPIIDKIDEMRPLLDEIDEYDDYGTDPWEISPTVKSLDRIVNEIWNYIKTEFKWELSLKSAKALPKWITRDKTIMKAIGKTRFEDVWIYIQENSMSRLKSYHFAMQRKMGKHEGKRHYIIFIPDHIDMENSLNLSSSTIRKYLKLFCEIGILKKLGTYKPKGRHKNVYAVGYWSSYPVEEEEEVTKDMPKSRDNLVNNNNGEEEETESRRMRKVFFLKDNKEMRTALKKFKVGSKL